MSLCGSDEKISATAIDLCGFRTVCQEASVAPVAE
jgi:hypothetical protein